MPGHIKGSTTFCAASEALPSISSGLTMEFSQSYAAVTNTMEPLGEPSPSLVQDIAAWHIGVLQEPCITSKDG